MGLESATTAAQGDFDSARHATIVIPGAGLYRLAIYTPREWDALPATAQPEMHIRFPGEIILGIQPLPPAGSPL